MSSEIKKCSSCGGTLVFKDQYTYQCSHCGQAYYISADRTHKVSVHLSVGKMIVMYALIAMVIVAASLGTYHHYTAKLAKAASRFSVVFREFLLEVYDKPVAKITEEDLVKIKYLRIERDGDYIFTYSYEDYFAYEDEEMYAKTLQSVSVEGAEDDFSPTNLQYFSGLTFVELYTGSWQNYKLPEENVIRSIHCTNGMSRYGVSGFFENVNPDTLEEVVILDAGDLDDFSFLENLYSIRSFTLEGAHLKSTDMFASFSNLAYLELDYVEMQQGETFDHVEQLLRIPTLTGFTIKGKAAWYMTEEQWAELEEKYGERIALSRQ